MEATGAGAAAHAHLAPSLGSPVEPPSLGLAGWLAANELESEKFACSFRRGRLRSLRQLYPLGAFCKRGEQNSPVGAGFLQPGSRAASSKRHHLPLALLLLLRLLRPFESIRNVRLKIPSTKLSRWLKTRARYWCRRQRYQAFALCLRLHFGTYNKWEAASIQGFTLMALC